MEGILYQLQMSVKHSKFRVYLILVEPRQSLPFFEDRETHKAEKGADVHVSDSAQKGHGYVCPDLNSIYCSGHLFFISAEYTYPVCSATDRSLENSGMKMFNQSE